MCCVCVCVCDMQLVILEVCSAVTVMETPSSRFDPTPPPLPTPCLSERLLCSFTVPMNRLAEEGEAADYLCVHRHSTLPREVVLL